MINTKQDRKNLYMTVDKLALVSKLKSLLGPLGGYILRPSDSKFVPKTVSIGWDAPWVYVQSSPILRCDIYHSVFYKILNHIHSSCRSCWKVVVRPQTLIQLLDLYEFQKEMGVPCKCGTEKRETVYGLYGGYFYTRSKKEGVERYKQVRRLVDECLSPDVSVILKRYCTEFELGGQGDVKGQGPSDQTPDATEEELEMEVYIESHFPRIGSNNSQPRFLIADVIKEWIHFAYQQGDETYKEVTGGKPLFPPYVTYHKERRNRNVIT